LIEQRAFPRDVLWGTERGAARACECFGWVRWSEALGIGTREGVVDCQLECRGGSFSGIEWAFGLFATFIFLHVDCSCYVFLTHYCAHNGLSLGPSLYFVIHSYHAQTMTHTPTDDSILVLLLVVLVARDSD
jgi:hypothetical protein